MNDVLLMVVICGPAMMLFSVGFLFGSNHQLKSMLPELNELRETVARHRLLSRLSACGQCHGERIVYNRISESFEPCPICGGKDGGRP